MSNKIKCIKGKYNWDNDVIPYANCIFEQPWWLDAVTKNTGGGWEEIIIKEDDEVVGRLPYCIKKNNIFMPQQTQTLGPWLRKDKRNFNLKVYNESLKQIIDSLPKVRNINVSLHKNNTFLPWLWKGFLISPTISYVIEDLSNLDNVMMNFSKNIRRDIRSAEKKLKVEEMIDADILYEMLEKSYEKQGRHTTSDYEILKNIIEAAKLHNACKMFTAYDDKGNRCASAFFVYDKHTCYYLKGGVDYRYSNTNAATLLIWKGICFASTVSEEFDFEGSSVEGISDYFCRFGGIPRTIYMVRKSSVLKDIFFVLKPRIKKMLGYKI